MAKSSASAGCSTKGPTAQRMAATIGRLASGSPSSAAVWMSPRVTRGDAQS
ncbi:hypothetical protein [Actinacidiphila glaucinigra]|uniref:hypothetical protein n=1 Tax=Actinacidiphila glaucinigra TaxID=235986 RepID=UPI002E346400|nr:hypothetical protein [Actinacidiphila glaucinigra]